MPDRRRRRPRESSELDKAISAKVDRGGEAGQITRGRRPPARRRDPSGSSGFRPPFEGGCDVVEGLAGSPLGEGEPRDEKPAFLRMRRTCSRRRILAYVGDDPARRGSSGGEQLPALGEQPLPHQQSRAGAVKTRTLSSSQPPFVGFCLCSRPSRRGRTGLRRRPFRIGPAVFGQGAMSASISSQIDGVLQKQLASTSSRF